MKLTFIPFVKAYENGKHGPVNDALAWARFSYEDFWPGLFFGLAAFSQFYLLLPPFWEAITNLNSGIGFGKLCLLVLIVLICYLPYSFSLLFCYWLGVQRSIHQKRK